MINGIFCSNANHCNAKDDDCKANAHNNYIFPKSLKILTFGYKFNQSMINGSGHSILDNLNSLIEITFGYFFLQTLIDHRSVGTRTCVLPRTIKKIYFNEKYKNKYNDELFSTLSPSIDVVFIKNLCINIVSTKNSKINL